MEQRRNVVEIRSWCSKTKFRHYSNVMCPLGRSLPYTINNCIDCSAIVKDQLIALGPSYVALAIRYNWRQLVVISAYVDASRKFALIGNFWDTVDRGRKRAYVACVLLKLVPVNLLVVEVEHARLSATICN